MDKNSWTCVANEHGDWKKSVNGLRSNQFDALYEDMQTRLHLDPQYFILSIVIQRIIL